MKIKNNKN